MGIRILDGIDIHPFRSPGNRGIRCGVETVKDYRKAGLVVLSDQQSRGPADSNPGILHKGTVYPGKRIFSGWVDYPELGSIHLHPSDARGVTSSDKELGACGGICQDK